MPSICLENRPRLELKRNAVGRRETAGSGINVESEHLSEDRLRNVASAKVELEEVDEEHLLNCRWCRTRFMELVKKLRVQ
jgi:hypothetical protein